MEVKRRRAQTMEVVFSTNIDRLFDVDGGPEEAYHAQNTKEAKGEDKALSAHKFKTALLQHDKISMTQFGLLSSLQMD